MEIKIANFKGVSTATIVAAPLAVVMGQNKAGKTSLCQATALALTGEGMPNLGIAKASAGALVHGGAEKGIVQIKTEDGKSVVKWPSAEVETSGKPPFSSGFAAGVCDKNNTWALFAMSQKERSKRLAEILDVLPSLEDLDATLKEAGLDESARERVIEAVKENDWDPVHEKMKKHGAKLKGQWEEVTGDNWGVAKAEGWIPDDWEEDLTDVALQSLEADKVRAQEALESLISETAVNQADVDALKAKADDLEEATAAYSEIETAYKKQEKALKTAKAALDKTDAPISIAAAVVMTCPHCNQNSHLERQGGEYLLVEPNEEGPDEEQQAAVKEVYDAAKKKSDDCAAVLQATRKMLTVAEARVDGAEKAGVALQEVGAAPEEQDESTIDGARQAVANCQSRIDKFNAFSRAATVNTSIGKNQKIVKILEPQGLRKTRLTDALEGFHAKLGVLCSTAEWAPVTLDEDDLELQYGPRRFALMSESEKFRTRCILQIALAQEEGSYAVVIDGADILDIPARTELFKLLMKTGIRGVVAMTLGSRDEIPSWMAKAFNGTKGNAYWIEEASIKSQLFTGEVP